MCLDYLKTNTNVFFYIEIGKCVKSYMLIYENSAFYFMMYPSDADEEIQIFAYDD